MALGKGAKIAIGCGIAVVLVGIAVIVAFVGAGFWLKGKAEELAGEQQKIEELHRKADANAFSRPADGVIEEARLVTFLDARKRVYGVYGKHKDEIEGASKKGKTDFGDVRKAFAWLSEIRLAQAQALADVGMSQDEYRFMVESIYKTMWAAEVEKSTGKTPSEAAAAAAAGAEEALAKAAEDANMPEEARKALREAQEQAKQSARETSEAARQLDVPEANLALFRKHEADIKKYAMSGLEWIGL